MAAAVIDLRSDTVTRPSPAMRHAMAHAEVGDDVFGDDPTTNDLQARVADLLGKEAALWVPSGTMANQVALRAQTRHGDEIIIGVGTHCWRFESGGLAALAGVQTQVVGTDGMFTAADVHAAYKAVDPYQAATRLVAVENTHGMSGGTVWDPAQLLSITEAAHALGMRTHLDGARIWNAAVASNTTERAIAAGFDSVSVCLSKGLGAPGGSLIAGTRAFIKDCHRLRKMYGGGMRQVGILAAAGLYALDHHRPRLADDHANARAFADILDGLPTLRVRPPQTNIVMIDLTHGTVAEIIAKARDAGVLIGANRVDARTLPGEAHLTQQLRVVMHLDVDRAGAERAAHVLRELCA
jgi:threonine aldolase